MPRDHALANKSPAMLNSSSQRLIGSGRSGKRSVRPMRDSSRVCGRPWTLSYVKVLRYTHHQASDMLYQQTEENNLQTAKRRAEREAADHKQKTLRFVIVLLPVSHQANQPFSLERELERLRNRLDRPPSGFGSPGK